MSGRNLELKARLADLDEARRRAAEIAHAHGGIQHQRDTYFRCQDGRLKLREIAEVGAELIWYRRPDGPEPRGSDYRRVPVENPDALRETLAVALGVRRVVEKSREIFFRDNVRIHLDDVQQLGAFLEFEAVLSASELEPESRQRLEYLRRHFQIDPGDLLATSYGEMA